ncbi:MAG: hypothetical protein V1708_01760 [Candidatus Micrarchaeota archaeon]
MEKKFFLESNSDLQRIGVRAQIVSFLIEHGILEGNALNDESSSKKVVVAIKYESKPPAAKTELDEINRLKHELAAHLNALSSHDAECYGQFPTDITASELYDLSNPHAVPLLDLQRLSSSLMLEQTSKGVGAMLSLSNSLRQFAMDLTPLKELPAILKKLSQK